MKAFKTITIFFTLTSLMVFSAVFPLLLSKSDDHRLLEQIHLQKFDADESNRPEQQDATYDSVIDKLKLLYDMNSNSKDIVVLKNTRLSVTNQEKIKTAYKSELLKLKDNKMLPDIAEDSSGGSEIDSFICSTTSRPDLTADFYTVKLYYSQYRITFTMDAETNKIYALDIKSTDGPLAIDYANWDIHWQDYIGFSLVKNEVSNEVSVTRPVREDVHSPGLSEASVSDYTDGSKKVAFTFFMYDDNRGFSIAPSF